MIILATTCLTLLHPAVAFQGAWHEANFTFKTKKNVLLKSSGNSMDEENGSGFRDVRLDDVMTGRK